MIFVVMQTLACVMFKTLGRLFFDLEVKGTENLKNQGEKGMIFAANHQGAFDPFIIGMAAPMAYLLKNLFRKKCIRILTYHKIMEKWYGCVIWILGSLAVYPKTGDIEVATAEAVKYLRKNQDIMIFPNGKRQPDFNPEDAKRGVSYIANKTGALIVPVYLNGSFNINIKDFIFKRRKIFVNFGPVFSLEDVKTGDETFRKEAVEVMRRVKGLE
jgi:1-acyl-sn-glycerol-3-phosphate acyltransferase